MQSSTYPFITPSSTCLSEDLLFFDTFSHYGSEKDNFDLVQFPSPVVIDLIKIIPLGQPIEAKIPGNVRLGATNPSNCELEFFINDLSKQDAHTMTDLGKFYCSEKETDFNPPTQIQTDGLLLRGSYKTLTLAIFGQIATYDEKTEEDPIILSASSPPAQTPASPVASDRDIPYIVRTVDQEILLRSRVEREDGSESLDESTQRSNDLMKEQQNDNVDMIDEAMVDTVESAGEIQDNNKDLDCNLEEMSSSEGMPASFTLDRDKKAEEIEYSNSTDLENNYAKHSSRDLTNIANSSLNMEDERSEDDHILCQEAEEWTFNVDKYCPKPLTYFPDPSLTLQELSIASHILKSSQAGYKDLTEREIEKVKEMFEALNSTEDFKTDEWVTLVEDLTNDIVNVSLSQTVSNDQMLKFLIDQVISGLDIKLALRQKQTGFKVRHLRAGIKLATILFHCGETAVSALLEASIPQKVLELYDQEQMSLPLRLLIFRCLNAICDTVEGSRHMIEHKYQWNSVDFSLANVMEKVMDKDSQNNKRPADLEESSARFESAPVSASPSSQTDSQFTSSLTSTKHGTDKNSIGVKSLDDKNQLTCYQYMILILLSKPTTRVTIAIGNLMKKIRLFQNFSKLTTLKPERPEESEDSVFDSSDNAIVGEVYNKEYLDQTIIIIQDIINLTKDNCYSTSQPVRYLPARVQFQVKPCSGDTYLAVYKWLKYFKTLEYFNTLLKASHIGSLDLTVPNVEIEQYIRLQNLCLLFIQQLLDSPRGTQLFLSNEFFETTSNLIRTLASKQSPKRMSHVRISDGIENCLSASLCREESLSTSNCNDMSLRMSYSFKVLSAIDKLFYFHRELISKRGEETSLCDPEKVLHQLYIMSDHPYGLAAIIKHFSSIGNLDCLLRFLDTPEHHKQLEFVKETSIDYALELIGTFLRLNDNVLEIADEYLDTLVDLCKNKDKTLSVRIKSLLAWLSPFDTEKTMPLITYSEETFRHLTRIIRKSIPNHSIPFANGLNFELPPHLITAVRILRQLCIPPQVESFISSNFDMFSMQKLIANQPRSSFMAFVDSLPHEQNHNLSWNLNIQLSKNNGSYNFFDEPISEQLNQISNTFKLFQPYDESICGDLKYHYGIMQVFEQEGLKRLLNTLRELAGNYPRPIYQSAALSGSRGRIVLSYIHSVIILLHSIVCHLIDAKGSEFKDTSIIPVVLETYSLLCFVPKPKIKKESSDQSQQQQGDSITTLHKSISLRSDNYQLAQQTKKLILSILMSYTQMCLSVSESEEKVISKSMWTKMLKEVVDFTLSTPVFFHDGLDVLTKILPPPLPCSSMMDSIDQEQLFKNINHRKLWSAHLHPLQQQIEQMISQLSICYQNNIRTLLYYLCNQLCDLSSNAACMVAKIITDNLVSSVTRLHLLEATGNNNNSSGSNNNNSPIESMNQQSQNEDGRHTKAHHNHHMQNTRNSSISLSGSTYTVKMILNLLLTLTTNQAFVTAFSNQLQVVAKKDEKLLTNLQNLLKMYGDCRACESIEESLNAGSSCVVSVNHLIELIKAMNDGSSTSNSKEGFISAAIEVNPPDELTKINLLEVARKTSDRFSLSTSLKQTYRLKVLLDLNSNAHRSSESNSSSKRFDHAPYNYQELSVPSSHKAYVAPLRGRGRPQARPDSFRLRPQNTSRPPSIHVDDFNDLYGDNSAQTVSSSRYGPSKSSVAVMDYRHSSRGYPDQVQHEAHQRHTSSSFFGPQPPLHSGSPYSSSGAGGTSGSSRSQHAKGKYMKMK